MIFEVVETPSKEDLKLTRRESRDLPLYDDVQDNLPLSSESLGRLALGRVAPCIFGSALVNFFEYILVNLLLILHVDRR